MKLSLKKPDLKLGKPMKLLKKQLAIVICSAIVIVAVAASYWPTRPWYEDLGQKIDSSLSLNSQITGLLTKQRNLPIVGVDPTPQPLTVFPTNDLIQKGTDAVKELDTRSLQLLDKTVALNTHIPLVSNVLPSGNNVDLARFSEVYLQAENDDSRIRAWPTADNANLRPGYTIPPLLAGRRITSDQINDRATQIRADADRNFVAHDASGNIIQSTKDAADQNFNEQVAGLGLKMELDDAKKFKVYIEKGSIKPPAVLAQFQAAVGNLALAQIWNAQLILWMQEDLASAVSYANADAHNVLDAPIKQITDMEVQDQPYLISGDPTAGNDTTALTPAPDVTPTGRVSNGMYDVVQFKLSLDVDATKVATVLDALQRGQFITIVYSQAQAVDVAGEAIAGFMYGDNPIVHLDLVGEELFLHKWTTPLVPANSGSAAAATSNGGGAPAQTSYFPITTHQAGS